MRKRIQKKSEVLREGYIKGLRKAQRIINEMMYQSQGFDDDLGGDYAESGNEYATDKDKKELDAELIQAVIHGNIKQVRSLLVFGADVNAQRRGDSATPLHVAVKNGDNHICKLLLDYGAQVHTKDKYGNTPLHYAAREGAHGICQQLLENGADPWVENARGDTPMTMAAWERNDHICDLMNNYVPYNDRGRRWGRG